MRTSCYTGMLSEEEQLVSSNQHYRNAMTMAVDFPWTESNGPLLTCGRMRPAHLHCVLLLLKAHIGMTVKQHARVTSALAHAAASSGDESSQEVRIPLRHSLLLSKSLFM